MRRAPIQAKARPDHARRRVAKHGRRRRGFTLVEALVAFAVSIVIVAAVWALFQVAIRYVYRTHKRLTAVQGAFMLSERLSLDLQQSLFLPGEAPLVAADGAEATLGVFDPSGSRLGRGEPLPTLRRANVCYRHGRTTGRFSWTRDGAVVNVDLGSFERVDFEWGASAGASPGTSALVLPQDEILEYRITCAAPEDLSVNLGMRSDDPRRRTHDVVTLVGCVGLAQRAAARDFRWWIDNPVPASPR